MLRPICGLVGNPAMGEVFYDAEALSFLSSEWGLPLAPSYAVAGGFLFTPLSVRR